MPYPRGINPLLNFLCAATAKAPRMPSQGFLWKVSNLEPFILVPGLVNVLHQ